MCARSKKPRKRKTGLPPGTVVYTGVHHDTPISVDVCRYDEQSFELIDTGNDERLELPGTTAGKVLWIDLRGVHDAELLKVLGQRYDIHPLALEDIADTHQRPKFDEYPSGVIMIFPSLHWSEETGEVAEEQISVYFNDSLVFSSQERAADIFTNVKARLQEGRGKIRSRSTDYLAYILIDHAVDSYYHILDKLQEQTELLENEIHDGKSAEFRQKIHYMKYEYLNLRKGLMPMRELVGRLSRADGLFIHEETRPYLRDLHDHMLQIIEQMEIQREVLYGLQELHLSEISFQMNRVMKVLTIITTIFVPLTFLAGIYGMNFHHMPELAYRYSYPILWLVMIAIALGLVYYFRKKDWL